MHLAKSRRVNHYTKSRRVNHYTCRVSTVSLQVSLGFPILLPSANATVPWLSQLSNRFAEHWQQTVLRIRHISGWLNISLQSGTLFKGGFERNAFFGWQFVATMQSGSTELLGELENYLSCTRAIWFFQTILNLRLFCLILFALPAKNPTRWAPLISLMQSCCVAPYPHLGRKKVQKVAVPRQKGIQLDSTSIITYWPHTGVVAVWGQNALCDLCLTQRDQSFAPSRFGICGPNRRQGLLHYLFTCLRAFAMSTRQGMAEKRMLLVRPFSKHFNPKDAHCRILV